ncbi:MAG: TOBE domain-containing protein, partial [Acetobacteraceae bacterium]
AEAGLALRLERAEYLGSDTVLHCRCGSEELPVLIRHPGRLEAATGAPLHAAFAREAVQLFEAESGRRLAAASARGT